MYKMLTLVTSLENELRELNEELDFSLQLGAIEKRFAEGGLMFSDEVIRFEKYLLTRALIQAGGKQCLAAKFLGLATSTFNYKVVRLGLIDTSKKRLEFNKNMLLDDR